MGAYRRRLRQGIQAFSGHPEGSYAHGRFLYLTDQLDTLGRRKNDLLDFNNAAVEIDHSPHDASQRNANTPLITVGQANTIVATLNVRVAALRISKGGVLNDITIA